jgi:anti-sigma factor RsiW
MSPRRRPGRAAGIDAALSRWLDGEASPEEARLVSKRLAADPALSAQVERLRADLDLFRDDARPKASGSLADRVLAAVAAGEPGPSDEERFRAAARRWSAAAAVLLALGVGGSLAIDRLAPASEAGDGETLTSLVERHRLSLEVDLALDRRDVAPAAGSPDAPSDAPSDARPR